MKKSILLPVAVISLSLILQACGGSPPACADPLGCVTVGPGESIQLAALLTLSGPNAPYGTDALRGVKLAIADRGPLMGHPIQVVPVDDLCSPEGGTQGATQIAADPQIVGVIGTTCSGGSVPAAQILSEAGMVLISPSSTAPSLTNPAEHRAGFLRTIYNDKVQGRSVAEFVYNALGLRTMATIHDGSPYSNELQAAACEDLAQLGGECVAQIQIESGSDVSATLTWVRQLDAGALYYPVYTTDGVAITSGAAELGLRAALISSDGLLSSDFIQLTQNASSGTYISGPAPAADSQEFVEKYLAAYNEEPIATFHLQGYDAAALLFSAIERAAVQSGRSLQIPRQGLRDALYATRGLQGLTGPLTCSPTGDCATPIIEIFQVRDRAFVPIYP